MQQCWEKILPHLQRIIVDFFVLFTSVANYNDIHTIDLLAMLAHHLARSDTGNCVIFYFQLVL